VIMPLLIGEVFVCSEMGVLVYGGGGTETGCFF
jgi:hypothetical protein